VLDYSAAVDCALREPAGEQAQEEPKDWGRSPRLRQDCGEWPAQGRYAILRAMDPVPPTTPTWLRWLRQTGRGTTAAAVLEAVSPLAAVGAQFLYLVQPLFSTSTELRRTARLLEDPGLLSRVIEDLGASEGGR